MPKSFSLKRFDLELIAFVAGASVMTLELVGSRLVAPFLGGSLIIWTTLIGVILACLSVGYALGGRLADRQPSRRTLGLITGAIGVLIALIGWQTRSIEPLAAGLVNAIGLELACVLIALALFGVPSLLLGMIPPYAIKLRLTSTGSTGTVAGNLYALSTAGSIVGTFLTGFWLVPVFGSMATLFGVSLVLLGAASLFAIRSSAAIGLAVVGLIGFATIADRPTHFGPLLLRAEYESAYGRFFVVEGMDRTTGRPGISLMTSSRIAQSARFLDGDDLVFEYTRFFDRLFEFNPASRSVLMIGGGAFTYPRHYLARDPFGDLEMDVVEIDPLLVHIAAQHFSLAENDRMRVHYQDGRLFLNNNERHFDAVLLDAFSAAGSVPFQLATREAVEHVYEALIDGGVAIVNVIGTAEGRYSRFVTAEFATYREVFGDARIYPLGSPADELRNMMIVAIKQGEWPDNGAETALPEWYIPPAARVLTDDWAPVDYYVSGIL